MGRRSKQKQLKTHAPAIRDRSIKLTGSVRILAIFLPVFVGVMGYLAFYPALSAEFVNYDDNKLFVDNTSYRGFAAKNLKWMFTTTFMGHYQPMTWLSSAIDYKISGDQPFSYHRTNLVFHALNVVLVYFLAMRLFRIVWKEKEKLNLASLFFASAIAALLFGLHPLRVESVAWASERRDVLSMFFLLGSLLAYMRAVSPDDVRIQSWRWYGVSCLWLMLSLLSKAWGMFFFAILIVLNVYPLGRLPSKWSNLFDRKYKQVWLQLIPYSVLGVIAAALAGFAQRSALNTMVPLSEWGLLERLVQAFYGLAFYLGKTVWPTSLAALYELPQELQFSNIKYWLCILFVVFATTILIFIRRRLPAITAAGVVYLILLVPVLGFFQSGPQFVADKYSYVSCIGWAVIVGSGLFYYWQRKPLNLLHLGSGLVVSVVIGLLFTMTWQQTKVWNNSKSLWTHALAVGAESSIAHTNLGTLLRQEKNFDQAIHHYQIALSIDPEAGNTWFNLANALKATNKYDDAEQAYLQAVDSMTQKHKGYLNLGNMYFNQLNRIDDAIDAYRKGVAYMEQHRKKMMSPGLYLALGIGLRTQGDYAQAREILLVAKRYKKTRARAQREINFLGEN